METKKAENNRRDEEDKAEAMNLFNKTKANFDATKTEFETAKSTKEAE